MDASVGCVLKSAIAAFKAIDCSEICCIDKGCLPQSIRWWQQQFGAFTTKVYQQHWKEWVGWFAQKGVPDSAISAPKLPDLVVQLLRLGLT